MASRPTTSVSSRRPSPSGRERRAGRQRRLIAGLRVSREDEVLLAAVSPFFPEADSAGDLAYRLWRRGLELSLAELVGLGLPLPLECSEEQLATLVVQRILLCLPLLRRTGKLALLGLEAAAPPAPPQQVQIAEPQTDIDLSASQSIAGMGGAEFL